MASMVKVQAAATPVVVPSLRPWPTAFDPVTVVTYLTGIVSSLVNAVLSPFAAGLPALPTDPSAWSLLAWVRRELFNESPTLTYNPVQNTQSLDDDGDVVVTGRVVVSDPDQEPHTYTVIGRPHDGGTVEIDEDGNFTYRPMNAMAAVGGTDSFTVVVSDEAAGLHCTVHSALLQFVPDPGQLPQPERRAPGGQDHHGRRRPRSTASTCRSPTTSTGASRTPASRPRAVPARPSTRIPTGTGGCTTRSTSCSG